MGRDDIHEPYEDDPRERTDPMGVLPEPRSGRPAGDVPDMMDALPDGWSELGLQDAARGDGTQVIVHVDGSREIIRNDGSRERVYPDDPRETTDVDGTPVPAYGGDEETARTRGFPGSGRREESGSERERRGRGRSRILLAVVGGVVAAGTAGALALSTFTGGPSGETCSPGARCSVAEQPSSTADPAPGETERPGEGPPTTAEPAPTPSRTARDQASPRPAPTRASPSREEEPEPTRRPEREEEPRSSTPPRAEITSGPRPETSPAEPLPTESPTPSQGPTSAPPAQDTGDGERGDRGGGGLLDWLL